jgi:hypothetical protein
MDQEPHRRHENYLRVIKYQMARIFLGLMLLNAVITTTYAEPDPTKPATVVFVCLHGSVKSQVAAAHFNRIAKARDLPVIAVSRGIAVDKEIPDSIREGLAGDGLVPTTVLLPLASCGVDKRMYGTRTLCPAETALTRT